MGSTAQLRELLVVDTDYRHPCRSAASSHVSDTEEPDSPANEIGTVQHRRGVGSECYDSAGKALGMLWFGDAGLVLGVAAGALVGTINGLVISLLKIPSFVTTLAMLIIVRAVVIIISDGTSIYMTDGSVSGGTNISSVAAPWLLSMGKFPAIFIVAAVVAAFMWIFYEKTLFGQQLKAVGGNENVLRLVGINVTTFKIKVFAAAGVMVGIASCVNLARAGAATPQAGLMIELDAIAAVAAVALGGTPLTGGYGSVVKTIIGALTLTVVRNGLTIAGVPPSWSQVALGALLIAAIAISLNRSKVDVVKWEPAIAGSAGWMSGYAFG